jgi:hypothetical protein
MWQKKLSLDMVLLRSLAFMPRCTRHVAWARSVSTFENYTMKDRVVPCNPKIPSSGNPERD